MMYMYFIVLCYYVYVIITISSSPPLFHTLMCCVYVVLSLQCAVLFYAFRQQGTLHPELSDFANIVSPITPIMMYKMNLDVIFVSFFSPSLSPSLPPLPPLFPQRLLKLTMYIPLLINPLLALLAIIFSWALQDIPGVVSPL